MCFLGALVYSGSLDVICNTHTEVADVAHGFQSKVTIFPLKIMKEKMVLLLFPLQAP